MTGQDAHSSHKPPFPPFKRLYQLLLPEAKDLWTVLLFAVLSGVLYLAVPLAVDALVNQLAFGASDGVYLQALVILSLGLFGFLVLLGLVRAAQYFVTELIQRRLFVRLSADLAYRLPRVRMEALDQKLGPDLVNRFFDVITVQKAGALILLDSVNLALSTIIGLLILGFYHPFLLLFDLILIAYVVFVLTVMARGAVSTSIDESYAKHRVAAWLEQVALFPYLFKSDGAEYLARIRANDFAEEYLDARSRHWRILFGQILSLLFLQALASAALLGLGGFLVLNAELTLGQLVAAELIVSAIVANLAGLGKHVEAFYDALAAVDKIGYVIDLPIERAGGERPERRGGSRVEIERLGFGYSPSRPVLTDVSLTLEPGERVALLGSAGAGTSTLLDILFGIRAPGNGEVVVDGTEVREWDLGELRHRVALVRGHDLVEASVFENVCFGRPGVSRQNVREALEKVGLLDDIMRLPGGLDAVLNVGGRPLSASQRTRLILARGIVGSPALLLLDGTLDDLEARALVELTGSVLMHDPNRTTLVVSHDPAVIELCDRTIDMASFGPIRTGVTGD